MSGLNGHSPAAPISVEDAVRRAIRDPEQRKAFRERYPSYDTDKLAEEITKCDADVIAFEEAITKAQRYKRECQDLIKQCQKRDAALKELGKDDA